MNPSSAMIATRGPKRARNSLISSPVCASSNPAKKTASGRARATRATNLRYVLGLSSQSSKRRSTNTRLGSEPPLLRQPSVRRRLVRVGLRDPEDRAQAGRVVLAGLALLCARGADQSEAGLGCSTGEIIGERSAVRDRDLDLRAARELKGPIIPRTAGSSAKGRVLAAHLYASQLPVWASESSHDW